MCTAATYKKNNFYFGRNLDYEFSYGDKVTITPRNYPLKFRFKGEMKNHYAIIGMAHIALNYPLYYDAMNEKGLCMAGLNFVGNACYHEEDSDKDNICQFEFIPWILAQCQNVNEVRVLLQKMNMVNIPFSSELPLAQLHWLIADKNEAITVEIVKEGINIYENKVGVLTNNPPFPYQIQALNNYLHLSPKNPLNLFSTELDLKCYSRGMGALGLPGDLSSQSRFIRVAFVKMNSKSGENEYEELSQFFHILNSVDQQRGCCEVKDNEFEITLYTSCMNADRGIYYYTTYDNHQISGVHMFNEDLNKVDLISFELFYGEHINMHN